MQITNNQIKNRLCILFPLLAVSVQNQSVSYQYVYPQHIYVSDFTIVQIKKMPYIEFLFQTKS